MLRNAIFYPKLLTTIRNYSFSIFYKDLLAGMLVAIVALPLAIAFGIASGASPGEGLITAIVAGFFISFLGGTRTLVGGPTGAFIVIIFQVIQNYGFRGLIGATILAGILLILMGVLRLGSWIRFVPAPVIVGFTSGIAVIIFSSQMKDLLGLGEISVPSGFIAQWKVYFQNLSSSEGYAVLISMLTIGIVGYLPKHFSKIPAAFIALLITTFIVYFFHLPVDTIGAKFGALSLSMPNWNFPFFSFDEVKILLSPAISIALLGAIESLMCAVVADGMIGGRHRPNTELVGQGIANIFSAFCGGLPATGAIARTATSIRSGARTPIAGIVHSLVLFLIIFSFSKWVSLIPMAALAGILTVVAYNMSEWKEWKFYFHTPKSDLAVLIITFLLTVFFDLILAIQVGMIIAVFLFMKRMSDASLIKRIEKSGKEESYEERKASLSHFEIPENVDVFEISGAFFFGATSKFSELLQTSPIGEKKYLILRMNQVIDLDASGIKILTHQAQELHNAGKRLLLAEIHPAVKKVVLNSRLPKLLTRNHIFGSIEDALAYARRHP